MKKRIKSVLCSALSAVLVLSNISTASFAAPAEDVQLNPLVAVIEKVEKGASMNLTEEGSLDWVHITGEQTNRKNGVMPIIQFENLDSGSPLTTANDSAMAYSWTDGTPTASQANFTAAGVFNYKSGDHTGEVTEDAGYQISIPAAEETRTLTFVSGIWEATATIAITVNNGQTPVYTTELSAGLDAQMNKYTVTIRPGNAVTVTTKITEKTHDYGNLSLGGIALKTAEPSPIAVKVQDPSAMPALNLTERGNVDWIHFEGSNGTTVRKANVTQQITYRSLSDNEITTMNDAPVKYSWTDGTPTGSAADNITGAVYTYKNGDEGTINTPLTEQAGYELEVAPADFDRELVVVSGVWNADAKISIILGGEETPVYENGDLTAGEAAVNKIYTVFIAAGKGVTVTGTITRKHHTYGNFNLQVAVLSTKQTLQDYKLQLTEQLAAAKKLNLADYDQFYANQLEAEIQNAKALLEGEAGNAEYYTAWLFLNQAYESCLKAEDLGSYTYETNSGLTASFGWEGDLHAPIAYIDGSYKLRDNGDKMVTFGVKDIPGDIKWYNAEGYLPCFVSEYAKDGMEYKIENFANKHTIDGNDFEIAYSRMTVKNNTEQERYLPRVSSYLVPLNNADENATKVAPGGTVVREYAIGADRFGGSYAYPADDVIAQQGSFDENYVEMKTYWNDRLSALTQLDLPDEQLVNAYKAGFIYTLIIRDDINGNKQLHVGENGYDILFDHDTIGIVASLLTEGDFTYAQEYLATLPAQLQYDDAKWKYSWPYALYLSKTGDYEFIQEKFDVIKGNTHNVETDRENNGEGIIKQTNAIDSYGYWLIDNWAALAGLSTYQYLCDELYEKYGTELYQTESKWTQAEYDSLLAAVEKAQRVMREKYNYPYLSIDMNVPTEQSARSDVRDANWASMFLFGRWGWDGYLFGAEQESSEMIALIDDTYTHGFERRKDISNTIYNFGGYPHGYYSSAYNAGYGSTALRGEMYRNLGIKAYQFMIEHAMSGPFGWWEGVDYPHTSSPWEINHAVGGGGSCQHMWGQSTASKVLIDSLVAEKINEKIIIGRGIPSEWIAAGESISVSNHVVEQGKRIGYTISTAADGKTVTIEFTGDTTELPLSIELIAFKNNISSVSTGKVKRESGIVTVPGGTEEVVVTLGEEVQTHSVTYTLTHVTAAEQPTAVVDGETLTATLTAESGYELPETITVTMGGTDLASGYTYSKETGTVTVPNVTGDVVITVSGVEKPAELTKYTVTLDPNGGSVNEKTLVVEEGKSLDLPIPSRAGSYRFLGWFDEEGNRVTSATPITRNMTLIAHWEYIGGNTHPVKPVQPVEPVRPTEPDINFIDVKVGDWYESAVEYVVKNGLMTGVGNSKFNPDGTVTRAMVWTVLARMDGENTEGGATWYSKAQEWAMRTGVSDGSNPMGSITREQLAAMLYRFEGSPAVSGNLSAYPDANTVSDWAKDAMIWATQEGIINGIGGKLSPKTGATRAQLAAMLMRMDENMQ